LSKKEQAMTKARIILGWTIVALTAVFVLFNLQLVEIGVVGLNLHLPLSLLLIAAVAAGIVFRPIAKRVVSLINSKDKSDRGS